MFGWCLSSQINNPQSYSKQRVTAGEKLDHLISISSPQGRATSPAEGWDEKQQQRSGGGGEGEAAVLGPRGHLGEPPSCWMCGDSVLPTDTLPGSVLTREVPRFLA